MTKVLSLRLSLSLFLSLPPLSLSLSLIHAYMCLTVSRRSRDLSVSMHSHSFQDTKFKLLIQVKDFQEQVVEGLTVLRYPGSEIKGSSLKQTLIQHAFAQVFKIQCWNFAGTSMTHRDRSWRGWRFYGTPVETSKDVVWQSVNGRLTSDHCRVTVQWLFSKKFLIARNVQKRSLTVGRRSRDLRPLSRDYSATFFKKISNCLKRRKIVVWQSADSRVTFDRCRVTVQRLFSNFFLIAWNVQKTLFDSQPTIAWPPTTVAWPFSDFFQNFPKLLETSKKRCLTVSRRSRDLRPLSRDRSATFFKIFPNCFKRPKNVVWQSADGRVTSDHCRVTVQRLFSKFSQIAWNVQKTLFDSRPTVAWPPTTVAWLFSDFFQKNF